MPGTLSELVRSWRAALLLVVLACASSGRAAAACGDHVTILAGATAETPAAPPPPCSGPNCSQRPDRHPPMPAPASPAGTPAKDVAPAAPAADPDQPPAARRGDLTSARPVRRAADIFHPPQCG